MSENLEKLLQVLKSSEADAWEVTETREKGWEFYLIRHALDQNRVKELTSFHSYLRFYYFHRKSGFSRREANRRISELLTREPYKDAMNHISRNLLTGQEYVFVTALKRRMFFALRMMIRIREWGKERLF